MYIWLTGAFCHIILIIGISGNDSALSDLILFSLTYSVCGSCILYALVIVRKPLDVSVTFQML